VKSFIGRLRNERLRALFGLPAQARAVLDAFADCNGSRPRAGVLRALPLPTTVATVKTSTQDPIFEWMKEGGSLLSPNASNLPSASRPPASPYLLGGRGWKGFEFFSAPFSPATPIRNNYAHPAKQDFTARTVSIRQLAANASLHDYQRR